MVRMIVEFVALWPIGIRLLAGMEDCDIVTMMNSHLIRQQFHVLRPDGAEHVGPRRHLGVFQFVALFGAELDGWG